MVKKKNSVATFTTFTAVSLLRLQTSALTRLQLWGGRSGQKVDEWLAPLRCSRARTNIRASGSCGCSLGAAATSSHPSTVSVRASKRPPGRAARDALGVE